jgi:hypothetical protein
LKATPDEGESVRYPADGGTLIVTVIEADEVEAREAPRVGDAYMVNTYEVPGVSCEQSMPAVKEMEGREGLRGNIFSGGEMLMAKISTGAPEEATPHDADTL